jgi:predicted nucleic acid-binding protein
VDSYLLDTTVLSISLDSSDPRHFDVVQSLSAIPPTSDQYISAVALAELAFGVNLASALNKGSSPVLSSIILKARKFAVLDISHHTSYAYATIKTLMAVKYLARPLRKSRPKYIEDWIDQASGKPLGIDENDLWMAAQAKERGLTFLTADRKIRRISEADPDLSMLFL